MYPAMPLQVQHGSDAGAVGDRSISEGKVIGAIPGSKPGQQFEAVVVSRFP